MSNLILREYSEDDKQALVELAKKGLSKEFSIKRWDWLYFSQALEGSHIVVAEYDNKVVGSFSAIKKRFVRNDEEFICARHLDPVVDASMRGKGVFSKMIKVLNEMTQNVDFIYAFPNDKAFPGFARSGYTPIGPLVNGYCHFDFRGSNYKNKIKYLRTGLKLLLCKDTRVEIGSLQDLKGCKWQRPVNKYSLNKDFNYLNWRYKQSPVKNYDVLICRDENGEVLNACIIAKGEGNFISIVDLIEYKSPIVIKEYLIAIQKLYGSVIVTLWKNNIDDNLEPFFWSYGKGGSFMVREGGKKMSDSLFQSQNWFISHGEVESN